MSSEDVLGGLVAAVIGLAILFLVALMVENGCDNSRRIYRLEQLHIEAPTKAEAEGGE